MLVDGRSARAHDVLVIDGPRVTLEAVGDGDDLGLVVAWSPSIRYAAAFAGESPPSVACPDPLLVAGGGESPPSVACRAPEATLLAGARESLTSVPTLRPHIHLTPVTRPLM